MKNLVKIFFLGLFLFAVYFFRFEISSYLPFLNYFEAKPCSSPVFYSLGSFDERFKISREDFLASILRAENIWEKVAGVNLFEYAENGKDIMPINLIFDYRQQTTDVLKDIGVVVDNSKASYESLQKKLELMKIEYERAKASFDALVLSYESQKSAYEKEVSFWNERGGAPKKEFEKIERDRLVLNEKAESLSKEQDELNKMVVEINALVSAINKLIDSLNLSVKKYNTTNMDRGESFEEGLFIKEGRASRIEIYEFSSQKKLDRVLAHELGHALGMEHIENDLSLMYKINDSDSLIPTEEDVLELKRVCGF